MSTSTDSSEKGWPSIISKYHFEIDEGSPMEHMITPIRALSTVPKDIIMML